MPTNNSSLRNKSLRARIKVSHVELFREDARLVLRYAVTVTYGNRDRKILKIFSALREKRVKPKNNFITHFYIRPHNRPYDACLWKPAKHNKVGTSKQLRFVASTETFNGNHALTTEYGCKPPCIAINYRV